MHVAQLVAPQKIVLADRATPEPGPDEVRIAVRVVGICGTDMEFYSGRRSHGYPFVLGHECSGTVDVAGPGGTDVAIGTRVTLRPNFGCGVCDRCREGRDNICPNSRGLGVTTDGCLREYVLAPARYLFPLPDRLDFEAGALIEPLAVAGRAVRRGAVDPGTRVLILGTGTIGLLAVRCAVLEGADVTAFDPIKDRLEIARTWGAAAVISEEAHLAELAGSGFDVVIETAGISTVVPTAVEHARPGGRIVLTGIPMDSARVATRFIVWRELELHGSFIYDAEDFARAATRLENGQVDAMSLVTHRFPLERTAGAFETIARRGGLKALIHITKEED